MKKAPAPPKEGLLRQVYNTVDALGGANLKQIIEYLPAARSPENTDPEPTREQIEKSLTNAQYRGYLVRAGDYWQVAPYDYYVTKMAHIKRVYNNSAQKKNRRKSPRPHNRVTEGRAIEVRPHAAKPMVDQVADDIEAEEEMEGEHSKSKSQLRRIAAKTEEGMTGWTPEAKLSIMRSADNQRFSQLLGQIEETSLRLNKSIYKGKHGHWTRRAFYGLAAGNVLAIALTIGYLIGRGI